MSSALSQVDVRVDWIEPSTSSVDVDASINTALASACVDRPSDGLICWGPRWPRHPPHRHRDSVELGWFSATCSPLPCFSVRQNSQRRTRSRSRAALNAVWNAPFAGVMKRPSPSGIRLRAAERPSSGLQKIGHRRCAGPLACRSCILAATSRPLTLRFLAPQCPRNRGARWRGWAVRTRPNAPPPGETSQPFRHSPCSVSAIGCSLRFARHGTSLPGASWRFNGYQPEMCAVASTIPRTSAGDAQSQARQLAHQVQPEVRPQGHRGAARHGRVVRATQVLHQLVEARPAKIAVSTTYNWTVGSSGSSSAATNRTACFGLRVPVAARTILVQL